MDAIALAPHADLPVPVPSDPLSADAASIPAAVDRAVAARARGGDREAFARLHDRYAPMVHAILLSHAPPREAQDLLQDVFARALADVERLRDDAKAGPWLAAIARHVAADLGRRRRPTVPLPDALPDARAPRPTDDALEVLEALRALPEAYRETLAMRLVEGMTGPEIAEKTGMTPGSVRVHLHRGMQILSRTLARRGKADE